MATRGFDLVVIGTGSAASAVASRCRAAGWSVAVVDSRPFGGTCALRGCDPKKVLVGAADALDWIQRMKGKGIHPDGARIDWPELIRFKRSFTEPVPQQREASLRKAGIETFHGRARFVGPTTVHVENDQLQGRHVVIATGAKPVDLKIPGQELLTFSDQFLELDRLPSDIVFVGGGYISFEFAHVAARAGAQARILHRSARPLRGFDPDLVSRLVQRTREIGVRVELETSVEGIEKVASGLVVRVSKGGQKETFETEMVVHGAGRVPDIDELDLAAAGIERGRPGITVNEYLQSVSNPAVYAAGDAVATGPPLTPVAAHDGRVVAENLLKGNRRKPNYTGVPSVVFTVPPLATVGLHEETARQRNLRFRVHHDDTTGWYSSRRVAEACSSFKVLIEEETERILGAHLLGSQADELINLFALAIRTGSRVGDLQDTMFAYPTHASDVSYML
jgi:glutathione reductase (NADPH)